MNFKRILSIILSICMMFTAASFPAMAATDSNGLVYVISNGEVTITEYTGSTTEVVIPSTIEGYPVTSIGVWAFVGCSYIESITIPDSVTLIGAYAISSCDSLVSIKVNENNPNYTSVDGVLFNKDKTELITCPAGKSGEYTIPDSVTLIGFGAFHMCSSITNITIPNGVTSIDNGAFMYCKSLTSITIPDSVTSIGNGAFESCSSLISITIPNSVTSIGDGAFAGCDSLSEVKYEGTAEDKENITFGDGNDILTDNWQNSFSCISGDVDGDGNVNNKDLGVLRRFLNDWDIEIDELASDVDRDGNVNNKDLGILRRYLNDWDVVLK